LSCTDCLNPVASPSQTTVYTVSTLGCGGVVVEIEVTVEIVPLPGLSVTDDQTIDLGQTVTVQGSNEIPTIPIDWYDDDSGDVLCTDCPKLVQKPSKPGEYHFRASAVNSLGCGEEQIVTITVVDPCEVEKIEAANAFTPNGDGFNDYFEIHNDGISSIGLVQVFNRWGEIVFETQGINDQWDGTFRGEPVNPGVYMYIIHGDCVNQSTFQLAGNVTVIR
jgi:gliding motility-associated-like protein